MSIFWMLLKRLRSQPMLAFSLLLGLTLATSAASAITIYAAGAMQRLLQTELASPPPPQERPGAVPTPVSPPGTFYVAANRRELTEKARIDAYTEELAQRLPQALRTGAPLLMHGAVAAPGEMVLASDPPGTRSRYLSLGFRRNLAAHITVSEGALPAQPRGDAAPKVLQALANDAALEQYGVRVGETLLVTTPDGGRTLTVQVVGRFRPKDPADPYWFDPEPPAIPEPGLTYNPRALAGVLFIPEEHWWNELGVRKITARFDWHFRFDIASLRANQVDRISQDLLQIERRVPLQLGGAQVAVSPVRSLALFQGKAEDLRLPLFTLSLPLLGLTAYFLWLAASLMIARRTGEMALMSSRGGSVLQILTGFLLEGLLLAGAATALGGPLGLLLAQLMGASTGFLQFVGRDPLPTELSLEAYLYAAAAALLGLLAILPPAIKAARRSMVAHKQQAARGEGRPLWEQLRLDLLLLGGTVYGYFWLRSLHEAGGSALPLSPVLLALPFLGMYALGLLVLRLLPYAASLLASLSGRTRGVTLPLAMLHSARQPEHWRPVVMLLILTVGLGTYSALAARSLDRAMTERIRFAAGADLRLEEEWPLIPGAQARSEPPFHMHRNLPGVAAAARVLQAPVRLAADGRAVLDGHLVAIEPQEFYRVAWYRRDLAPRPLGDYLLMLAANPDGLLVSNRLLRDLGLKPGTLLELTPGWHQPREGEVLPRFRILAGLDYWPGLDQVGRPFFVVNLEPIRRRFGLQPYQVWFSLKEGASPADVVHALADRGVTVTRARYAEALLYQERTGPQRTGLNGLLSLSFLAAVGVTFTALALHLQTSLQTRLPQFGIMRAMGLSISQLLGVLALEFTLAAGTGLLAGTLAGSAAARLFLPLVESGTTSAIPFLVLGRQEDLTRLYAVIGLMVGAAMVWVGARAAGLKLHVAIKLGEE